MEKSTRERIRAYVKKLVLKRYAVETGLWNFNYEISKIASRINSQFGGYASLSLSERVVYCEYSRDLIVAYSYPKGKEVNVWDVFFKKTYNSRSYTRYDISHGREMKDYVENAINNFMKRESEFNKNEYNVGLCSLHQSPKDLSGYPISSTSKRATTKTKRTPTKTKRTPTRRTKK